jgi:4-amino-4-deoxy-L-arabinose transferase-like glycosyltransferase
MLCWSLGGRRSAQALTMFFIITVPIYLGLDSFLSMNSWESMFWMPCLLALILLLKEQGQRPFMWWTTFGISAGFGLLNKPSMVFFLVCMGFGLLLTPQRRILFTRHAAWGITLLILIALPNVLWQVHNHWPTLEFLHNGRVEGKNTKLPPVSFILNQLVVLGPWTAFIWIAGLVRLLRQRDERWLGLTYLTFLAVMVTLGAKDYYVAPIYPVLFAAGGVAWQQRFATRPSVVQDRILAFPLAFATALIFGALLLPISIPVLRPIPFLAYQRALHLPSTDSENGPHSILPQFYADRFGWQENLDEITRIVNQLSQQDRAHAGIFTGNYGQAASLEWLGDLEHRNLPTVISEHNNYWLWGTRGLDAEVMIIDRATTPAALSKFYEQVQIVGRVDNPLSMPYERHNIYLVRHRKMPLAPDWAESKFYY